MVNIYFAKKKKKSKSLTIGDLKRSPIVAFAPKWIIYIVALDKGLNFGK